MIYSLPQAGIEARIASREMKVGFVGLGRVGLPLAATLAAEGFHVIGVDVKKEVVEKINQGVSIFPGEAGLEELLQQVIEDGKLVATTDIAAVNSCDVIVIAVPTLIRGTEPDIDAVKAVAVELAENMSPGKVVVLQSTVPPFTTQAILGGTIERETGLKAGVDFGLAYSPERTQASQALQDLRTYPKIVGGIDEKSTFTVSMVYSTFASGIVRMNSLVAAELEKVIENTYRDVNIAFANELAGVCELYGVDVYDIIKAANSQPYSHILNPGLIGGHCIPMDPYYLLSDARKRGVELELSGKARELNEAMFSHIADMVEDGAKRVAVLGLSFKADVKAFEHSHTLKLLQALQNKGYEVVVHDPFWDDEPFPFKVEKELYKAIEGSDCLILSTAHSEYEKMDLARIRQEMRGGLVVDIRGVLDPDEVVRSGLRYKGLGRVLYD